VPSPRSCISERISSKPRAWASPGLTAAYTGGSIGTYDLPFNSLQVAGAFVSRRWHDRHQVQRAQCSRYAQPCLHDRHIPRTRHRQAVKVTPTTIGARRPV